MTAKNRTRRGDAAQAQPAAARFNPYSEDAGSACELARRMAALFDTSPFSLWDEQEVGELDGEFPVVAQDMANSARARRLAVAFAMGTSSGMPESTRMLVLADWAGVALRKLPSEEAGAVLRQTIELAHAVAGSPDPATFPGLDDALARLDHSPDRAHWLGALEDIARNAIEHFAHPAERELRSTPAYSTWWNAVETLGALAHVLGDESEAGFEECERLMAGHLYPWAQPGANRRAPVLQLVHRARVAQGLDEEDRAEFYPEQHALKAYAVTALAEAGDDDAAQTRVLGAVADALVEHDVSAYADGAARTRALLRELRLDGRPMPEVIASYRRILADRDDDCSGASGADPATCDCSKCMADRAFEDRFPATFEQSYVAHYTLGDRPAHERLADILGAFEYAFNETSEQVFDAALATLTGKKVG